MVETGMAETNKNASLSIDQVRRVRANNALPKGDPAKLTQQTLAEELGVPWRVVSRLVRGVTYRGVE